MDFARQKRDPTRHLIGITFVILVHVLVVYALVTGLAREAGGVIKKPLPPAIVEGMKAGHAAPPALVPPPPPPAVAPRAPPAPVVRGNGKPVSVVEPEYPREARKKEL